VRVCVFICVCVCFVYVYVYVFTLIVCFMIVYACKVVGGLPAVCRVTELNFTYLLLRLAFMLFILLCNINIRIKNATFRLESICNSYQYGDGDFSTDGRSEYTKSEIANNGFGQFIIDLSICKPLKIVCVE